MPIARQMPPPDDETPAPTAEPGLQANNGGGNLNGSRNTANLLGQAGTAGNRLGVARQNKGNFCGVT